MFLARLKPIGTWAAVLVVVMVAICCREVSAAASSILTISNPWRTTHSGTMAPAAGPPLAPRPAPHAPRQPRPPPSSAAVSASTNTAPAQFNPPQAGLLLSALLAVLGAVGAVAARRPRPALAAMTGKYALLQEDASSQDKMTEMVVKTLKDRYGDAETQRVVKAWRRMEAGVVHTESHGAHPMMTQRCTLFVEGLSASPRPVWENAAIGWGTHLEENWRLIQAELQEVVQQGPEALASEGEEGWVSPVASGACEAYGPDWRILNIMERGQWDPHAAKRFPETCRILREAELPLMEAEFALLPAEGEIAPHSDGWNFMLTAHLPLIVPKYSSALHLEVGDTSTQWKEGEMLLFDSSFMHAAHNRSEEDRYILLLRVWHPEVTAVEVQALSFLLECLAQREFKGGKSLRDEPPPAEPYLIDIGEDSWKLPGNCNSFDTRLFGKDLVLYDVVEETYMACQGGSRYYVEPGGQYELRRLEPTKAEPATPVQPSKQSEESAEDDPEAEDPPSPSPAP